MSFRWIPLPFPKCPKCQQSWVRSYHRNCLTGGEVLVELNHRQSKCEGCTKEWPLKDTQFYCSCGHNFYASEVEKALSTAELLRSRLIQQIEAMNTAEIAIFRTSQRSLNDWLDDLSFELGKLLGTTAASLKRLLRDLVKRL